MKPIRLRSSKFWITGGLLLVWSVTMSRLLTTTAQAEWYVGGYGGISNPGAFSNVTLSDPIIGGGVSHARINDIELKASLAWGAKAGYFFETRPWLGFETVSRIHFHEGINVTCLERLFGSIKGG